MQFEADATIWYLIVTLLLAPHCHNHNTKLREASTHTSAKAHA